MSPVTWVVLAVVAAAVLGVLLLARRRARNSGATRARDVDAVDAAHPGAYGAHTQHQTNLHQGLGPF